MTESESVNDCDSRPAFRIEAARVAIPLAIIAGLLVSIHVIYLFLAVRGEGYAPVKGHRMFNLDHEDSLPTFFSATLLLICGALLSLIALHKRRNAERFARSWSILALIFFCLACDESISLHEKMHNPTVALLHPTGFFSIAWVIPGLVIVGVLGIAYARFLIDLSPESRRLFVLAACLYLGGALGCEMIAARYFRDQSRFAFGCIVAVEEGLEMLGAITFIYALVDYLQRHYPEIKLRFGADR